MDHPTVEAIQALLILTAFSGSIGKISPAWNNLGLAIRMASYLKLDLEPDDHDELKNLPWVLKESRRRTYWLSYPIDGNLSYLTGRLT
jgi:hypothetical protein